ncbi:MAG: hypothetical protein AAGH88_08945 [Planctomycetota bacterium]
MINIRLAGDRLLEAVAHYRGLARDYYYQAILSGYACPKCKAALHMIGESRCRCGACGHEFDPTPVFQRCGICGGIPRLNVRRYQCQSCGADVASRFVFDGIVYDADYFREKMAESRQRKQDERQSAQERHADTVVSNASSSWEPATIDLAASTGLLDALNGLTGQARAEVDTWLKLAGAFEDATFDLDAYQNHIQAHLRPFETCFEDIPALLPDHPKLDRIWRFIAIIFLAHAGRIEIYQEADEIWLRPHHALDREGPTVPHDAGPTPA